MALRTADGSEIVPTRVPSTRSRRLRRSASRSERVSRVPAGRSVEVRVPASSANLGPGFDSIGLALGLWDHYVVTTSETPGLVIEVSGEGADDVPTDERHLVHATSGIPGGCSAVNRRSACASRPATACHTAVVSAPRPPPSWRGSLRHRPSRMPTSPRWESPSRSTWPWRRTSRVCSRDTPDNASASVLGGLTVRLDARRERPRPWRPDRDGLDRPAPRGRGGRPRARDLLATRTARAVLPEMVLLAANPPRVPGVLPSRARPGRPTRATCSPRRATGSTRRRGVRPTPRRWGSSMPCAPRVTRRSCQVRVRASSCSRPARRSPPWRRRTTARAGSGSPRGCPSGAPPPLRADDSSSATGGVPGGILGFAPLAAFTQAGAPPPR